MRTLVQVLALLFVVCESLAQNVGIGTSTPGFKLDVRTGSINTDSVYRIGGNTILSVKGFENTFVGNTAGGATNSGRYNAAGGFGALASNTTGNYNTAFGYKALFSSVNSSNSTAFGTSALFSNTFGASNSAHGVNALYYNTTGSYNTGIGSHALYLNAVGSDNTGVGESALFSNNGHGNTALGSLSLYANAGGSLNTAIGSSALQNNSGGNFNTAVGHNALFSNTTAVSNTAVGVDALYSTTTGHHNTVSGDLAMYYNISGFRNTAIGSAAMYQNTTGNKNTAVGEQALWNTTASDFNTAIGFHAASMNMGWNNTLIGAEADATGNAFFNSIALGNIATVNGSNQARIGNSFTVSIGGYTGWSNVSDSRFKRNIKEEVKGLEFILKLRPVTYQLDITALSKQLNESRGHEINPQVSAAITEKEKMIFSGFLAQEVEQVARAIGYDFSGIDKPANANSFYGLRYAEFVVPLVKAVQELSKQNDLLQKEIEAFKMEVSLHSRMQQQQLEKMKMEIETVKEQHRLLGRLLEKEKGGL